MRKHFKRRGNEITVRLTGPERTFLAGLPELLRSVDAEPRDPAHARLHVAAYPDDPAAQADIDEFANPQMADTREADRERFRRSLGRLAENSGLDRDEAESWLIVVGDARLALAARLGITEPGWEEGGMDDPERIALGFLSYLQAQLTDALMETL